jgi:hypothetical protein
LRGWPGIGEDSGVSQKVLEVVLGEMLIRYKLAEPDTTTRARVPSW